MQVQPTLDPSLDIGGLIQHLLTAWNGHAYTIVVAIVVGTLVALAKQGWMSAWLAAHLPSKSLPFIAMVLGVLGTTAAQIQAGVPWVQALINGVLAGMAATAGHQAFIESARGGKEIVPPTEKVAGQSPPQSPPPTSGVTDVVRREAGLLSKPPPPVVKYASAFAVALCLACVAVTTGCAAWWADFKQNPGQVVATFVQYVESFLQSAATIWAMLAPLLSTGATAATATFNEAVVTANHALAVLQDAVHAAVVAQQPNPDFSKLIADVQDAVAHVMAVIAQYRTAAPNVGASADALTHQAAVISAWQR